MTPLLSTPTLPVRLHPFKSRPATRFSNKVNFRFLFHRKLQSNERPHICRQRAARPPRYVIERAQLHRA